MAEDVIELNDPDPLWPEQFIAESRAIEMALRPLQPRIEHFGSTAVPNLLAKPIIDILIILADPSVWPRVVSPLTKLGYLYWAENPRSDRMFFVKGMPPFGLRRSHHIHVRTPDDTVAELRFRDWLREHPDDAARYAQFKRELAGRFSTDREAYTEAKTGFIQEILRRS